MRLRNLVLALLLWAGCEVPALADECLQAAIVHCVNNAVPTCLPATVPPDYDWQAYGVCLAYNAWDCVWAGAAACGSPVPQCTVLDLYNCIPHYSCSSALSCNAAVARCYLTECW